MPSYATLSFIISAIYITLYTVNFHLLWDYGIARFKVGQMFILGQNHCLAGRCLKRAWPPCYHVTVDSHDTVCFQEEITFLCSFDEFVSILIVGFTESAWKSNISHNLYSAFPLYPTDTAQAPGLTRSTALMLWGWSQHERHLVSCLFRALNQTSATAKLKG